MSEKSWRAEVRHIRYLKNSMCVVPECKNTRLEMPHKLFFSFPSDPKRRLKWQLACGVRNKAQNNNFVPVCEDHFNLPEDMSNWYQYQLVPGTRPRLKPTAVPRVNKKVNTRTASEKRAKKRMVAELLASAGVTDTPAKVKRRKSSQNSETDPDDLMNEQHCIPSDGDTAVSATEESQTSENPAESETVYIKSEPIDLLETEISEPIQEVQNPVNETVCLKSESWDLADSLKSEPWDFADSIDEPECQVEEQSKPIGDTEDEDDPLHTINSIESDAPIVYRLPVPVSPQPIPDKSRDFGIQTQPPVVHATRERGIQARPVCHTSRGTQVMIKPETVDRGCSPIQFLGEHEFVVCNVKTE